MLPAAPGGSARARGGSQRPFSSWTESRTGMVLSAALAAQPWGRGEEEAPSPCPREQGRQMGQAPVWSDHRGHHDHFQGWKQVLGPGRLGVTPAAPALSHRCGARESAWTGFPQIPPPVSSGDSVA